MVSLLCHPQGGFFSSVEDICPSTSPGIISDASSPELIALDRSPEFFQAFEAASVDCMKDDPAALQFVNEMCRRVYAIVEAYVKLTSKEQASTNMSEVLREIEVLEKFYDAAKGYDESKSTVCANGLCDLSAVQRILKKGNLFEKMTMLYTTLLHFLPNEVYKDPEFVKRINEKLSGFSINVDVLEQDRSRGLEMVRGKMRLPQLDFIQKFRKSQGRLPKAKESPLQGVPVDKKSLSISQWRTAFPKMDLVEISKEVEKLQEGKESWLERLELPWIPGRDVHELNPDSDFYRDAEILGGLPLFCGPSGTTDTFLTSARYLGMDQYGNGFQDFVKALIPWMVELGNHSVHEVRSVAHHYGIPYDPSDDAAFTEFCEGKVFARANEMMGAMKV